MTSLRLTHRGIRLFLLAFFVVLYATSCQNNAKETGEDPGIMVEIDSTYYAMNPMDLQFDSVEQVMIASGMAKLLDAYRGIRAYALPNSTPPAIQFNPLPYGFQLPPPTPKIAWEIPKGISRPNWEARPGLYVHP